MLVRTSGSHHIFNHASRGVLVMTHHDDCITFTIPGLPFFADQVDTHDPTEAVSEAEDVLAEFLGATVDAGMEIPVTGFLKGAKVAKAESHTDPNAGRMTATVVLVGRPHAREPVRINVSLTTDQLDRIDEARSKRGLTRRCYLVEAALAVD